MREGETGLDAAGSNFFFGGMLDEELADELDEEETSACAPLPGAPDVVSRCTDTGRRGYPLLGSARGAQEADNRLRGRSQDQALLSTIKACN